MKRQFLIKFAQFDLWHWSCLCFSFSGFWKFLCNDSKLDTLLLCNSLKHCLQQWYLLWKAIHPVLLYQQWGTTVAFPRPDPKTWYFPRFLRSTVASCYLCNQAGIFNKHQYPLSGLGYLCPLSLLPSQGRNVHKWFHIR